MMTTGTLPPPSAPLDVRFEWTADEFVRSFDEADRHARKFLPKWSEWVKWVFLALFYVVTIPRYIHTPADAVRVAAITCAILFVCWLIPTLARRMFPRVLDWEVGPEYRSILTTIGEEGVRRGNGRREKFYAWPRLHSAVETEEFLLIYYRWCNAFYIPRRVLSPAALDEARTMIRRHLGDRAKLRND